MQLRPDDRTLPRVRGPVNAVIRVPGSKSVANRALLVAALADGRSRLLGVPDCDDSLRMVEGLRQLGTPIRVDAERGVTTVEGIGGAWRGEDVHIDAGDGGTVLRFLTAAACLGQGEVRLDGSEQLRARPIGKLVDALAALGAHIEYLSNAGHCPLWVQAAGLRGGQVTFDAPESSQFVSAVLMAAPLARHDVYVEIAGPPASRPYVAMTKAIMESFGAAVVADYSGRFIVPAGQRYCPADMTVEADASAAAYFFALAALTGGRVTVAGLTRQSLQGDVGAVDLLCRMGCRVEEAEAGLCVVGPADDRLRGLEADLADTPDITPTLAVVAAFANGPTRLGGLGSLRYKESNRIFTIAQNLERLGAQTEIGEDSLTIRPHLSMGPAVIESFDDHRIAMAFSLASARLDGMVIRGAGCVRKSFPAFFETLQSAAQTARA